jgi:hypothetical protein
MVTNIYKLGPFGCFEFTPFFEMQLDITGLTQH